MVKRWNVTHGKTNMGMIEAIPCGIRRMAQMMGLKPSTVCHLSIRGSCVDCENISKNVSPFKVRGQEDSLANTQMLRY